MDKLQTKYAMKTRKMQVKSPTHVILFVCGVFLGFGENLASEVTSHRHKSSDPTYHISNIRVCSEDVLELVTTMAEEEVQQSLKTNIFIVIFTTAHARLKLYSALETLQERVLYYDTDSVIYKWRPGQSETPLGVFFGEWTDEVEGDPIIEFTSGGAKNYGYRTRGGKVECKVRGFSLNYRNKLLLNFHALRDNILQELEDPREERRCIKLVDKNFFERDQTNKRIRLIERKKKYGLVFWGGG